MNEKINTYLWHIFVVGTVCSGHWDTGKAPLSRFSSEGGGVRWKGKKPLRLAFERGRGVVVVVAGGQRCSVEKKRPKHT
jgi:hypothetical protein